MAEHRNARGNGERIESTFPIRETNGDTKMKNISPSALPHFHGLTTKDRDTFLLEFFVIYRTYDYAEDEQKLKLFPSTLKDAALCWFMGYLAIESQLGLRCSKPLTTSIETIVGQKILKKKFSE